MADGINYALLIGVGKYDNDDILDLPTYADDCKLMEESLVQGLHFLKENIRKVGEDGEVTSKAFTYSLLNFKNALTEKDTFVMYFTGHGLDNALHFTDILVELSSIVRVVDGLPAKRKLIILDCCHSGAAKTPDVEVLPKTFDLQLADFIDHGTTIMASSGAEQKAGFFEGHSLYTGMLCKAIMHDRTTRNGRKSLWDINDMVLNMMDEWNIGHSEKVQYPIFRSSEIGTLSFNVSNSEKPEPDNALKNINPVMVAADYTITSVKSLSTDSVKRNCAFVMLKCDNTEENITRITNEVVELVKGMNLDDKHHGLEAKVVWCYFGLDSSDMIKDNYFLYTIWTDDPAGIFMDTR